MADAQNQPETHITSSADRTAAASDSVISTLSARRFVQDEKTLWTAPLRIKSVEVPLLLVLAGSTAALTQADSDLATKMGSNHVAFGQRASDGGVALFGGGAAGFFFAGVVGDNAHARETGLLMGEAASHAFIVDSGLQAVFRRARPSDPGSGNFFAGGTSFPSNHAAVAWAAATVLANEYPGWGTKFLSYGLASAVSAGRLAGRKHFTSDVLVGSALGWMVGREFYRMHHDQSLGGATWGISEADSVPRVPAPAELGSPYVPLDSWVYSAFDRLAALGYAPTGFGNLRPWTRMECARLLGDIAEQLSEGDQQSTPYELYSELKSEFASDLRRLTGTAASELRLDSVYTRYLAIAGPPLADGYHFGQTLINDYGRPYGRGSNLVSGASAWGNAGPVAFYIRGEYQHASALPAYTDSVQQLIGSIDQTPPQLPIHTASLDQVRLLDAYAAWNFRSVELSLGRQSLWWGPNRGGPLMYSNNASPMDMLRVSKTSPAKLPSLLSWLGPMRWEFFFGMMADHHYPAHPAIHGEKISFKPTPNLEFGFSRTLIFKPDTLGRFVKGFVSVGSTNMDPGSQRDVGDRRGGFDFSYRVPGLRKWLMVYNDSMTDDDPSPLSAPRRSVMNPGIYLPQIPGIAKLDLRIEAPFSDTPFVADRGGHFFYWNGAFHDAYTNGGGLLGSWVGRQARGLQFWSTYWFSPRNTLQWSYREARVAREFIPAGGRLQDFSVRAEFIAPRGLEVSTVVQHERWNFPVLASRGKSDTTASVQLTYRQLWRKTTPKGH